MNSPDAAKRKRDPQSTRNAILDAAQSCLAKFGAEGVSVSAVAKLAGVNRGTAYQHFHSKDELIDATLGRVSQQLLDAVFEKSNPTDKSSSKISLTELSAEQLPEVVNGMVNFNLKLAEYTIENPEISRIWLFDVLSRDNPRDDVFYKRFEESMSKIFASDACEPGINLQAHAVMLLSSYFMWPTWVRTQTRSKKDRRESARIFAQEMVRLSLRGVFKSTDSATLEDVLPHI